MEVSCKSIVSVELLPLRYQNRQRNDRECVLSYPPFNYVLVNHFRASRSFSVGMLGVNLCARFSAFIRLFLCTKANSQSGTSTTVSAYLLVKSVTAFLSSESNAYLAILYQLMEMLNECPLIDVT